MRLLLSPTGQVLPTGCEVHHRTMHVSECSAGSYRWDEGAATVPWGWLDSSIPRTTWKELSLYSLDVWFSSFTFLFTFSTLCGSSCPVKSAPRLGVAEVWDSLVDKCSPCLQVWQSVEELPGSFILCVRSPTWILSKQKNHMIWFLYQKWTRESTGSILVI